MSWQLANAIVDFVQALAIVGLAVEVVRLRRRVSLSPPTRITVDDLLLEELRDADEWGATTVPIAIRLEDYRAAQHRGPFRTRVEP